MDAAGRTGPLSAGTPRGAMAACGQGDGVRDGAVPAGEGLIRSPHGYGHGGAGLFGAVLIGSSSSPNQNFTLWAWVTRA